MDTTIIFISTIILVGGLTQGLTGFGLGLVAVPLLSLIIDPKMAVPLAGVFAWIVTWPVAWKMRQHVNYKIAFILLLGAVPGSFLGAKILSSMTPEYVSIFVGLTLIIGSCYSIFVKPSETKKTSVVTTCIVGFASGVLGVLGGGPIVAYMALQPWSANETKSTMAFFFMLQMVGVIISYWKEGLITPEVTHFVIYAMPTFLIGLFAGMYGYSALQKYKINYHRIVHGLLLFMGCTLVLNNIY